MNIVGKLLFGIFDIGKSGGAAATGASGPLGAAASALGMSQSSLQQELNSGKTIDQIAQEKNKDPAMVHQAMANAIMAQSGGTLSSAQAMNEATEMSSQLGGVSASKKPSICMANSGFDRGNPAQLWQQQPANNHSWSSGPSQGDQLRSMGITLPLAA